ncbi:MAG TPA: isoprenyl transferase [Smithellaceae bacterium]|jgi:undecaprenyl diphosphate synthase|nr:isoprenyl transferase [Smithellaceae bacterium]HNQ17752.1 isoprenyl transferase [Smithellaceae bacterium]HNT90254.1 isoprenyl transferase [Smithellaceae bacterium]HNV63569.1 isoprenyl transferase [Smithellaceae bacterium]HNZ30766.1 isoprenyl transferase [Smithellaceae bacterium]
MKKLDFNKLPRHIAIVMDGNGRWAKKHTIGRIRGHEKGVQAVKTTVRACLEIGIKYLTLFAFSMENWNRPDEEVQALMSLLEKYLDKETKQLNKQGIRLEIIGDLDLLNPSLKAKVLQAREETKNNERMILNMALSYGGRDEIVNAVKKIIREIRENKINIENINKGFFSNYLYTAGLPDPDLLIRTSGEYRISNFLLWQMAYTELYFTNILWPDFTKEHLLKAIATYQKRERRFGLTSEQINKN